MAALKIRMYGDSILRKKCQPIQEVSEKYKRIFEDMAQTMYEAGGIGLAAPQVGIDRQLIVVDVGGGLVRLANPKILKRKGEEILEEGCLSLPDISLKIKRAKSISIQGLNQENQRLRIEADDLLARALQHEVDHLLGVLIIDRVPWFERIGLRKRLQRLRFLADARGGEFHEGMCK